MKGAIIMTYKTVTAAFSAAVLAATTIPSAPAIASSPDSNGADEIIERCMEFVEAGLYYESIGKCIRTFNKSEVEVCQNNRQLPPELAIDKNQGQCVKRNRNQTRGQ